MDENSDVVGRQIYLPLEELKECAGCHKAGGQDVKLRLCTSCAEEAYCSPECQKEDWKNHKMKCGKTDRVDIQSFYPLLAAIIQVSHAHPDIRHPALTHKIINNPDPISGEIVTFPDGSSAKLVILGEEVQQEALRDGLEGWWPSGSTAKVRHRLFRRIVNEGLLLPILLATTIALVSEMYTTTSFPAYETPKWQATGHRRVRLTHDRSPITDFGIVRGTVRVVPQDRLAYYNIEKHDFMMGQDPNDHYWIYFTTLSGGEYFLDCGKSTFNFGVMVQTDPYCTAGLPPMGLAPAFWFGREYVKALPALNRISWVPRKKTSILRESRLARMLASFEFDYCDCHDKPMLYTLMDEIAGRTCTTWEREMFLKLLPNACKVLRLNMQSRTYIKFPKEPTMGIETDPGETLDDGEPGEEEKLHANLKKWSRKLKKGKITAAQWEKAFRAWKDKPHESRVDMLPKIAK